MTLGPSSSASEIVAHLTSLRNDANIAGMVRYRIDTSTAFGIATLRMRTWSGLLNPIYVDYRSRQRVFRHVAHAAKKTDRMSAFVAIPAATAIGKLLVPGATLAVVSGSRIAMKMTPSAKGIAMPVELRVLSAVKRRKKIIPMRNGSIN